MARSKRPQCSDLCEDRLLAAAMRPGKGALKGAHAALVDFDVECSVDFDQALAGVAPNASRWDYFMAHRYRKMTVAVEVHPAKASEASSMIQKKKWSAAELAKRCEALPGPRANWHWLVPSKSRIQFTPVSPQARLLAKNGIRFPKRRLTESDLMDD